MQKKDTSLWQLYQTVKKAKNTKLNHIKSYDDILLLPQLQPHEVKTLLNNDKSLKLMKYNLNDSQTIRNQQETFRNKNQTDDKTYRSYNKQIIGQFLEQSVRKQNLLIQKQLFDPYKYFGTSSKLKNYQESTRHHTSKLDAMFSQNNSPAATDHSMSYRKTKLSANTSRINLDVQRISNSQLIQKLEKLQSHQKSLKARRLAKQSRQNKQNLMDNSTIMMDETKRKISETKKIDFNQNNQNYSPLYYKKQNSKQSQTNTLKSKQTEHQQSFILNKKTSIENLIKNKTKIACSPKNYVKETKQNYLKMNLNNMQKVRLKLKLSSKNQKN